MTKDNDWVPPTTIYEKMPAEHLKWRGFIPQDGRQRVCGYYPDFVNYKTKQIVEIYGPGTTSCDPRRTAVLFKAGWHIEWITNEDVDMRARRKKYEDLTVVGPGVFRRKTKIKLKGQ